MLTRLTIEGFLRVAYANVDLTGAAIHGFYGGNEQGKSSIAEAVRFVYRGVSRRIARKGDYDMLITNGKRTGSVEIIENDVPIRRNIKDGNLTTRSSMNFEDLHVDLQLGGELFGLTKEDELRPLMLQLFKAKADENMVRERLIAKGVGPQVLELAVPLIKSVGFSVAHEKAKAKGAEARGAWRNIAGSTYGHVKAETWRPDALNAEVPTDEQVAAMTAELNRLTGVRDSYRTALTAAKTTIELTGKVSDGTTLEDAEAALKLAEQTLAECDEQIAIAKERYDKAIAEDQERVAKADRDLIHAKNAATKLACPCCEAPLQIVMVENEPVLERAVEERNGTANVAAAAAALSAARQGLQARKQGRDTTMAGLNKTRGEAQDAVHSERATLDNVRRLSKMPKVTKEELTELQTQLNLVNEPLAAAQARLDEMQLKRKHHAQALESEKRAKEQHELAKQWALVEEACGPTSAGIPAELVSRITKPINDAIAGIADLWGCYPIIITPEMSVQGDDGMPYMLMSESAQWRAEVMIRLALAELTDLKVAVIDRFDVVERRAAFFDMLSQYTQMNPEVTVLAFGTLKNTPPAFDGVKFHHVEAGAVRTIQQAELEHAD